MYPDAGIEGLDQVGLVSSGGIQPAPDQFRQIDRQLLLGQGIGQGIGSFATLQKGGQQGIHIIGLHLSQEGSGQLSGPRQVALGQATESGGPDGRPFLQGSQGDQRLDHGFSLERT